MQKGEYEKILFEKRGHVGYVTLNSPKNLNSFGATMVAEIIDVFTDMGEDEEIWGAIITGNGRAFCAGADQSDPIPLKGSYAEGWRDSRLQYNYRMVETIENFGRPVIAAINGYALGGGLEIALACDLRVMSTAAKVGLPEVRLGALANAGGGTRLARLIGPGKAKELVYTGRHVIATDALAMGIVNKVAEPEDLMTAANALMDEILAQCPTAVKCAKILLNHMDEMTNSAAYELERVLAPAIHMTEDRGEAQAAFREKRKPVFKGR